ncbi:MAG: hypothetical protein ACI4Q8_06430 [Ruminococcus sp.]
MENKIDLRTADEVAFETEFMEVLQNLTDNNLTNVTVRNKHEAYGVASQHIAELQKYDKNTKTDLNSLMTLLPIENCSAMQVIHALNTIYSTCVAIGQKAMLTGAIMQHMIKDFYIQAQEDNEEPNPLERLAEDTEDFEEVEEITEEENE